MSINGWRYYNHAAIPTTPPHIEPDLNPIDSGIIWHNLGGVLHYLQSGHLTGIAITRQTGGIA